MKLAPATSIDSLEVQRILWDAFGSEHGPVVASIATDLLKDDTAQPAFAFMAEEAGQEVGCIVFSNITIDTAPHIKASILAPLGVMRDYQNQGIGKGLVQQGMQSLETYGVEVVFAYGDPNYYRRFGFSSNHQIKAPHRLNHPDAWLVLELRSGAVTGIAGKASCAAPLDDPQIW